MNYSEADAFHKGYDIIIRRHDRYYPIMIHSHDFYEIVCVVDGTGAQFIGTDRGILSRGDIVVIAPGTKHSIAFYEDNCIVYNLAIKLSTFETIFKELLANRHILTDFFNKTIHEKSVNSYVVFHTHDYLLGDNYLADIEQEFEGGRAYCADMLNTLTHLFFLHLMRNSLQILLYP